MSHHFSQCQSISMFPKNHYVATSVFPYDFPFTSMYTSYGGTNGLPGFPSHHGFTMPWGCRIGRLGGAAPAQLGQFPIVSTMEFTWIYHGFYHELQIERDCNLILWVFSARNSLGTWNMWSKQRFRWYGSHVVAWCPGTRGTLKILPTSLKMVI